MKVCMTCLRRFDDAQASCPIDETPLLSARDDIVDAAEVLVGRRLDERFEVKAILGRGGMGAVYRATQSSVGRDVALKVLLGTRDQELVRRFMREARATSSLSSVHTVRVYDFGKSPENLLYLAMELLEGADLKARVEASGPLPWQLALRVSAQIADSLDEAHGKGIIHRDLKPSNVFLTAMGRQHDFVKVLDFGIAKFVQALESRLTRTGNIVGTPAWMSPEQARAEPMDARSDLYSLGCVLFFALTGRAPFVADNPVALMLKHVGEPPPTLAAANPAVDAPPDVEALVADLLTKRPDERIGSARALADRAMALLDARPAQDPDLQSLLRAASAVRQHRGLALVPVIGGSAAARSALVAKARAQLGEPWRWLDATALPSADALLEATRDAPTALFVDALQRAGEPLLDALTQALRRCVNARLLVVLTVAEEVAEPLLRRVDAPPSRTHALRLPPAAQAPAEGGEGLPDATRVDLT